jgi:hypothetical protein
MRVFFDVFPRRGIEALHDDLVAPIETTRRWWAPSRFLEELLKLGRFSLTQLPQAALETVASQPLIEDNFSSQGVWHFSA